MIFNFYITYFNCCEFLIIIIVGIFQCLCKVCAKLSFPEAEGTVSLYSLTLFTQKIILVNC